MRDQRPTNTARRKKRYEEQLMRGITTPPCVLCIEAHHTAGAHHDSQLKAHVCQKHHRAIHEQILRAEISLTFEPDRNKRIAMALRSAAVYDRERADAMDRWAAWLYAPTFLQLQQ